MTDKPTPKMYRVLRLMVQGWELSNDVSILVGGWWLQQGGTGYGGTTEKISVSTSKGLLNRRLIRMAKNGFPSRIYVATPEGVAAVKESVA